ncbi:DNA alkylation repair protein [Tropicimonas sp. S265A]|uniref:DNA alkylation repair protein n=1 Tax=Tropicimonas sp. S265A TaxID=3415134 RepID=UPI003C79A174
MTAERALANIKALANPQKAADMARYHKVERVYLGVANPELDALAKTWREGLSVSDRASLADGLWQSDIFEARIAAAKSLTQARLRPEDDPAWQVIAGWVPEFDCWAIADAACIAGQKRLVANPARVNEVAAWTCADHMWSRRAALVITLPWTKQNHPKPAEQAIRDRVLGWAAGYVDDPDWFIQKAVAWWIRDLSKHDRPRAEAFLAGPGQSLKPFAQREAARHLQIDS